MPSVFIPFVCFFFICISWSPSLLIIFSIGHIHKVTIHWSFVGDSVFPQFLVLGFFACYQEYFKQNMYHLDKYSIITVEKNEFLLLTKFNFFSENYAFYIKKHLDPTCFSRELVLLRHKLFLCHWSWLLPAANLHKSQNSGIKIKLKLGHK